MVDHSKSEMTVDGVSIALRRIDGQTPGVAWLGGYRSDMSGTKAERLAEWAGRSGHAYLRHDYSGHGESGGDFADGTISKWVAQSLAVFSAHSHGPQILVGSSMGAWIALRMIQELRKAGEAKRIAGLVLIAPAADFTQELVEPKLTAPQKRSLAENGFFAEPSEYDSSPYVYTRALIEDGRANRLMDRPIDTHCSVHILQGLADKDVPVAHALKLASLMPADDVTVTLVPEGDHRLSRPQDLDMLVRAVAAMVVQR